MRPTHPVSATVSMPWESLRTTRQTAGLPLESEAWPKHASGSSRVSAGGGASSRGYKSSEREGIRVRLTTKRVVVVTTRELGGVVAAAVGGIANPTDGRAAAIGLLIGYGVGWLWDSFGRDPS